MKSLNDFTKLMNVLVSIKHHREVELFMSENEYNETMDFLNEITKTGVTTERHSEHKDTQIDIVHYGGFKFNIIKY